MEKAQKLLKQVSIYRFIFREVDFPITDIHFFKRFIDPDYHRCY